MFAAVMFLTRIRVPAAARRAPLARAVAWFPLVGAALGLAGAGIAQLLHRHAGAPAMMTALLVVALAVWVTGAIHLDGLADAADGFGGGRTPDAVLRIMRDPRVGSFGVLAVVLAISIKASAMATLVERHAEGAFLVAAPAVARWTVVPLALALPYARPSGGLGAAVTDSRRVGPAAIATVLAAAIAVAAAGAAAPVALTVAALITLAVGAHARRRIGGVTGDVFGACIELTETGVLVTGVFLT